MTRYVRGIHLVLAIIGSGKALSRSATQGSPRFRSFANFLLNKQAEILQTIEKEDGSGATFARDPWQRDADGSFGLTTCLEDGDLVEKGAASVSIVYGKLTEDRARAMSGRRGEPYQAGQKYSAAALSLVFHPRSPLVPTFRADVRYFEVEGGRDEGAEEEGEVTAVLASNAPLTTPPSTPSFASSSASPPSGWFGGGADLTPAYLFDEDCVEFHAAYRAVCDQHQTRGLRMPPTPSSQLKGSASSASSSSSSTSTPLPSSSPLYADLKRRCDAYFLLPARGEVRGVGGIFFDDLTGDGSGGGGGEELEEGLGKAQEFAQGVADTWLDSWLPICRKRRVLPYTPEQRDWQLMRRGRYLEFNLLYDRGVRFGLVPGGRTEAVMVSAPPLIRWKYNFEPAPGSEEARLIQVLKNPVDWLREDAQ
mmetsp:Transcript_88907/g.177798  ORF Transcript_88907/g.177798 Transcript_88907/m.177798 type:complete len:422 (+) Transcript_88907:75-1340(+)